MIYAHHVFAARDLDAAGSRARLLAASRRHYTRYAMVPILLATAFAMFIPAQQVSRIAAHRASLAAAAEPEPVGPHLPLVSRQHRGEYALRARRTLHHHARRGRPDLPRNAQRSVLPDFSKDGGRPPSHRASQTSGCRLYRAAESGSADRFTTPRTSCAQGVDWVILRSDSPAALSCPYDNNLLKVCKLHP